MQIQRFISSIDLREEKLIIDSDIKVIQEYIHLGKPNISSKNTNQKHHSYTNINISYSMEITVLILHFALYFNLINYVFQVDA